MFLFSICYYSIIIIDLRASAASTEVASKSVHLSVCLLVSLSHAAILSAEVNLAG